MKRLIVRNNIDSNIKYTTVIPLQEKVISILMKSQPEEVGKLLHANELELSMYSGMKI